MRVDIMNARQIYDLLRAERRVWSTREIASLTVDLDSVDHTTAQSVMSKVSSRCCKLARQGYLLHPDSTHWIATELA